MSKRTQSKTPTENGATKRPRLDIQEQIKRAGILAEQLRNTVSKNDVDSKTAASGQIATEELVRIFESMQEQTADTSDSVDALINSSIKLEVKVMMDYLSIRCHNNSTLALWKEIWLHLKPENGPFTNKVIKRVQEKMEGVRSGDYVSEIKEMVKVVLVEELQKGVGIELRAVMP
ncbi:hypothetical protein D6D19_10124 [Aureobasidium pullulans]|uniref:Uncharacterized protein n=1 Tax=Aureobasidium pullulans TaxID=5580 RepID=A0A4S9KTA9_AURPU|nr:hypothetical protein D6D19_10124 [Aureobasidium pullulans]THY19636.1 hypothetical protein D6D00_07586 [Aureobasidium pullulans]